MTTPHLSDALRPPIWLIMAAMMLWPMRGVIAQTDSAAQPAAAVRPAGHDSTAGSETVVAAVTAAARDYQRTGIARTIEAGASVIYPYGHGQPTVTCAPLRACVIELDAGETVLSRIAGDTQRWEIELAPAGSDGRTQLVVVKPHDCGLTTNLVLSTTAGRIYDLTLDSPPCPGGGSNPHGVYVRHVRFYYPDATVAVWPAAAVPILPASSAATRAPAPAHADAFNFAYHVQRERRFPWSPLAVFDDGFHCYIKLPPRAAQRDTPVLFQLADDGSRTLLNYSLSNDTFVTDRVFRTGILVIGEGAAEHVLRLENLHFDGPVDASTDQASSRSSTPAPDGSSP